MNPINTYLAVYLGSPTSPRLKTWMAMSDSERQVQTQEGIAAWKSWGEKYQASIVFNGGPLGKTKHVSQSGIVDSQNELAAFTIVRASSHEEAAKMFESHPHFTIFPGSAVEVMPLMPIPGN